MAGLAALGAVGIYIATRGKKSSSLPVSNLPKPLVVPSGSVTPAKPKTLKFFEKQGLKTEKGEILNADGTGYTGVLKAPGKNGESFEIVYKNGLIQKSNKFSNNIVVHSKEYNYYPNGKLKSIYDDNLNNLLFVIEDGGLMPGKTGLKVHKMAHNTKIVQTIKEIDNGYAYKYYQNGKLIAEELSEEGCFALSLYKDGKKFFREAGVDDIELFDSNGKVKKTINIFDDFEEYTKYQAMIKAVRGY